MKSLALLFPGQGSQSVGMHQDYIAAKPELAAYLEQSDSILGYKLSELFLSGEEEELKKTEHTQPALYITGALSYNLLCEAGIQATHAAGHSLGEYTALYAAGAFDYETGLRLVQARGKAFAEAGRVQAGSMAAVLGLAGETVREICRNVQTQENLVVVPANFNDPSQTVISGSPEGVNRACELAKEAGAKRALVLPVSGAFHSPLVESAGAVMKVQLAAAQVLPPSLKFVNNVEAAFLSEPESIRTSLVKQVTSSVRWVESIETLIQAGVTTFVEVGAGKVLSGLVRRINKEVTVHTTETHAKLLETIDTLTAEGFTAS
ncbi:MAG: ACP S-malonyltransferase [Sumerlaeia bacterium]